MKSKQDPFWSKFDLGESNFDVLLQFRSQELTRYQGEKPFLNLTIITGLGAGIGFGVRGLGAGTGFGLSITEKQLFQKRFSIHSHVKNTK